MLTYEPLRSYLMGLEAQKKTLSFKQIEAILGQPLPRSAYNYQAWWANEIEPAQPQKLAWSAAGFASEVDIKSKTVRFYR